MKGPRTSAQSKKTYSPSWSPRYEPDIAQIFQATKTHFNISLLLSDPSDPSDPRWADRIMFCLDWTGQDRTGQIHVRYTQTNKNRDKVISLTSFKSNNCMGCPWLPTAASWPLH